MLPALEVPITEALGCRAAADVTVGRAVPSFRQAALDGVAVNVSDGRSASLTTPVILPLGPGVRAGTVAEPIAEGHGARVATGAQVPANADAVVGPDCYEIEVDKITLTRAPVPGEGIREVGSQFSAGETVVQRGQVLGHVGIAELALIGRPRVTVHPKPRVIIVTVGSELVRVSSPPTPVTLHDATGVLLTTTAARLGVNCHRVGPIPDDARAVRDAIEDQLVRADVIVTAGGIDTPDDVLRQELQSAGIARFDGPRLAPCSAYGVGRIGPDRTPVIALPGDPASAALAFHALVRPVIDAMFGRESSTRSDAVVPPRRPAVGSRLVPGWFEGERFVPVATEPLALRDLAPVTGIAIHHAGQGTAEVVEWLY